MTNEQLRALMASMRLDPYCSGNRRFVGVVDVNALPSCVGNDCRKGTYWRSGLLRMTDKGIATLYASHRLCFVGKSVKRYEFKDTGICQK